MNKKLLLISNSTNRGEKYLGWCLPLIQDFCSRHGVKSVLFVPYAGVTAGYDAYTEKVRAIYETIGIKLYSVHTEKDPVAAVNEAECIAVGGGNTFNLVYEMQRTGVMAAIAKRASEGVPYMGWSAGSNVAGLSLKTTNDMPIVEPLSFDCMGLVPFQINPHYTDFFDPKHGGETRDDRLLEFITLEPHCWVAAIREATALSLEEGNLKLIGRDNKMKVFRGDKGDAKEYSLQDNINFLMK